MKELSQKKKFEIANICYACIAGEFADFCNERNRGLNFSWAKWIVSCENKVPSWIAFHSALANNPNVILTAKEYSKQISTELVQRAGFNKEIKK